MCEFAEQVILLDALNGDQAAVASRVAGMSPAERQTFREGKGGLGSALGVDCEACQGIVPVREAISIGPLGGPFARYHQACTPAS